MMTPIQVGLVDTTGQIDEGLMEEAAAALHIQVTRDLPQFWPIQASVTYLRDPNQIPVGVWPVMLVATLPPDEGGYHSTKHNQPFAMVIATPDDNSWTIDASHETLEMLVDPYGNRLQASLSIEIVGNGVQDGTGEFQYLVEACDPCEANDYAYPIQGISVSDFITPHYYDPMTTPNTSYSFTGAIKAPRQILPGGYISFINVEQDEIQQILWVDPSGPPVLNDLGSADGGLSLREYVDNKTRSLVEKLNRPNRQLAAHCKQRREKLATFTAARSKFYFTGK
jgi:hypothetical protein